EEFNPASPKPSADLSPIPLSAKADSPLGRLSMEMLAPPRRLPLTPAHVHATKRVRRALEAAFGWECVGSQAPIQVSEDSDPEPDGFVLSKPTESFIETPTANDCLLVVEVSDATLGWDKTEKLRLYAQAEEYLHVRTWTELESVAPLARPDTQITVRELLP
ncbi:Uma2 family endonuclease, partial [Armatimonas sp.]|uniref:Uma2 family endonuclease n=1 Tax=Armatimonas sp. TaxID=1872638 RepID=UPI0037533C4E